MSNKCEKCILKALILNVNTLLNLISPIYLTQYHFSIYLKKIYLETEVYQSGSPYLESNLRFFEGQKIPISPPFRQ